MINFLNVLLVALPVAKTTSYPTNRMSEKPWDVVRLIIKQISYLVGLLELLKRNHMLELSLYLFLSLVV